MYPKSWRIILICSLFFLLSYVVEFILHIFLFDYLSNEYYVAIICGSTTIIYSINLVFNCIIFCQNKENTYDNLESLTCFQIINISNVFILAIGIVFEGFLNFIPRIYLIVFGQIILAITFFASFNIFVVSVYNSNIKSYCNRYEIV